MRALTVSFSVILSLTVTEFFPRAEAQIGPPYDPATLEECQRLGIPESQCSEQAIREKQNQVATTQNPVDWSIVGMTIVAVAAVVGVIVAAIKIKRPKTSE